MKKKTVLWMLAILLLIAAGGFGLYRANLKVNSHKYRVTQTATVFFHGWGSSYHAEEQMANYLQQVHATNKIIRAEVAKNGQVFFYGQIGKKAKNPVVEVNLENNRSVNGGSSDIAGGYSRSSRYVYDVLHAINKQFGITSVNLVGHSMGNLQIAYYLKNYQKQAHLPEVKKVVSIAGHYNGFLGEPHAPKKVSFNKEGLPSKISNGYRGLLKLHQTYPKTISVLNIYGDIGNGTDGSVAVQSAQSYRYLASRAKSYREVKITKHAQHSQLHENKQVDRLLAQFLYGK